MKNLFVICAFIAIVHHVIALPTGAPTAACFTLSPMHSANLPQTSPAPVTIEISNNAIRPGDTITVRLVANGSFSFRGFIVQARNVVAPNSPIGTMIAGDLGQAIDCTGFTTVTHINNLNKDAVEFQWTAPPTNAGVRLYFSIVQEYTTFWTGMVSEIIDVYQGNPAPFIKARK